MNINPYNDQREEQIIKEIENQMGSDKKKMPLAVQLIGLIDNQGIILFSDQYKEPHVILPGQGSQAIKVKSRDFKLWLSGLAWKRLGKTLSNEIGQTVLSILEAKALHDGKQIELSVRVGRRGDGLFYDLGDGRVVKITGEGWSIIEDSPVLFRRLRHQRQQICPIKGGDVQELLGFVNILSDDNNRNKMLLFLVYIVALFIPGFPHPVIVVHGPQGSAKSTLFQLIKSLVDPSELAKMAPKSDLGEFILTAATHWFLPFDNLSYLKEWLSDAICRACTGEGFSKRELYTDSDEVVFSFQRVIGINGINLVVDKPDLLDRSILFELSSICGTSRKPEESFWAEFEAAKPRILGAIFDVLSEALREIGNVKLDALPRMADFAKWGTAISRAMGVNDHEFLTAYQESILSQHEEAIAASPVAQTVIELMENSNKWEGTPSNLLAELNALAGRLQIDTRGKDWPKEANWVWRRLREAQNNLEAIGLAIEREGKGSKRIISIRKVSKDGVNAVMVSDSPSGGATGVSR